MVFGLTSSVSHIIFVLLHHVLRGFPMGKVISVILNSALGNHIIKDRKNDSLNSGLGKGIGLLVLLLLP